MSEQTYNKHNPIAIIKEFDDNKWVSITHADQLLGRNIEFCIVLREELTDKESFNLHSRSKYLYNIGYVLKTLLK